MKRTQLYLDNDLWSILHLSADRTGTSVSQLVRDAVRERYIGKFEERRKAMLAFVGLRKDRNDPGDSTAYVRDLRRGNRLERLGSE
jgi:hypothetical protein